MPIPAGGDIATHQGRTALYRLYDVDEELIYVGITNNQQVRWRDHAAKKPWWKDVAVREIEWFPTRAEAEAAEARLISRERPRWNDAPGMPERGKPGSTSGHLRPGWEPDQHILQLVAQYEEDQCLAAQSRDKLEAAIVAVMRTGVSAVRISKFLPMSTPMIQAIGKRAGVPLLRKPTVVSIRSESA